MLGAENGAIVILRPTIFKSLQPRKQNAAFRSAFGSNAGKLMEDFEYLV